MASRVDYIYSEDTGAGAPVAITGATTTVRVIRKADNYVLNNAGAFVDPAGGPTLPTMTEDAGTSGHYYHSVTTSTWNDGYYARVCTLYKTGKSPLQITDEFVVTDGSYSPASGPGSPTSPDYCRCYIYFAELPSTEPTNTVVYLDFPANVDTMADATPATVYSSGTGLWYTDLLQGAMARVTFSDFHYDLPFKVPAEATHSLSAL